MGRARVFEDNNKPHPPHTTKKQNKINAGADVPRAVRAVFLSHLHSDHINALPDLANFYVFGRTAPLHIYGASGPTAATGTAAMVDGLRRFLAWDRAARALIDGPDRVDNGSALVAHEFPWAVQNQLVYDARGVRVYATPVKHYESAGPVRGWERKSGGGGEGG